MPSKTSYGIFDRKSSLAKFLPQQGKLLKYKKNMASQNRHGFT
jgi:hypothetical protein